MTTPTDPFGPEAHDKSYKNEHSGKYGHYCCEWDGLWICEDCSEFECCLCFGDETKNVLKKTVDK